MNIQKTGAFIAERRKQLHITQQQLGEKLCITDKAVSKWERGQAFPDIELFGRLAVELKCSITELMNGRAESYDGSSNVGISITNDTVLRDNPSESVKAVFDMDSVQILSPYLFGNNLEHTHSCVNSGLSAQMLKNRKFTGKPSCYYGCAEKWFAIGEKAWLGFGDSYTRHHPDYHMSRQFERNSQMITNYAQDSPCGIGQHGLCLQKGVSYVCRVIAKSLQPTLLKIALTDRHGEIYAESETTLDNVEFVEIEVVLQTYADDCDADLRITFNQYGTITIGTVSLMPQYNFHGMRSDVVDLMKEMGIRILRWPGGNFAGDYYWKDGLLPVDMRSPLESHWRLDTQPHTNGYDYHEINTDDFIALCREIGAEPFITLNPTWNTAQEDGQWAEYCNGDETTEYGKMRMERGHAEPYQVQFWSLGNEFGYGHMEGENTPYGYTKTVEAHAKALRNATPHLVLCSSGPHPNKDWVDHVVKPFEGFVQLVSLHCYPFYPSFQDPALIEKEYYQFLGLVDSQAKTLIQNMKQMIDETKVNISFDEWNAWYSWYRPCSVCEGIFVASMLHMIMRESEKMRIQLACHFQAVNEGAIRVEPDRAFLTPSGQMMAIMQNHANGRCLTMERDLVATEKDRIITVTMINRSYDTEKSFCFPYRGTILTCKLYTSEDITPPSTFTLHDVQPVIAKNHIELTLAPHSVFFFQMESRDDIEKGEQ